MEPLYRTLSAERMEPEYECLSYVWGKPDFTKPIKLNGRSFFITENLDLALRNIRQWPKARMLWVDALCINQEDFIERGQQVVLMKEIYQHCRADLVWLLCPSMGWSWMEEQIAEGLRLMQEIYRSDFAKVKEMESPWHWLSDQDVPKHDEFRGFFDEDEGPRKTQDLLSLFRFNYDSTSQVRAALREARVWDRVWITQELACSPNIRLMVPDFELDWEIVYSFLADPKYRNCIETTVAGHEDDVNISLWGYVLEMVRTIEYQRSIVREARKGAESGLMNTLVRFRCTHATDVRDKIYGLLGLVSESHGITVDYQKSPQDVFTQVTLALINNSANADIICQNYWYTNRKESLMPGLPSWVADFTQTRDLRDLYRTFLFGQRSVFCAGRPVLQVPCEVTGNNVLRQKGSSLGRIKRIANGEELLSESVVEGVRYWMQTLFGDMDSMKNEHSKAYVTGEPMFMAFWRTAVMDCKAYPIQRLEQEELDEEGLRISLLLEGKKDNIPTPSSWGVLEQNILHWTFCIIKGELFGMVLGTVTEAGDEVVVLDGGKVPVVLRAVTDDDCSSIRRYHVVHVAYVHGFMDGQVQNWVADGRIKETEFCIV